MKLRYTLIAVLALSSSLALAAQYSDYRVTIAAGQDKEVHIQDKHTYLDCYLSAADPAQSMASGYVDITVDGKTQYINSTASSVSWANVKKHDGKVDVYVEGSYDLKINNGQWIYCA